MVRILADIHTTEATIETKVIYPDTALMVFNKEQEEIFRKHKVTKEQFEDTYDYYLENLKKMDKLYEMVVDTLVMRESKVQVKEGIKPQPQEVQ
ncbi:MAG: DUF4296 domain-containing protein [Pontibacter sp.]|nr:DUF4296 domain-containing protein [Pontibacter sp.]